MIEGLKVTVKGTELRGLCETRAAYLEKRSGEYAEQSARFANDPPDDPPGSSNTSNSPRKTLQDKADDYGDRGRHMRFVAGHLVDAEDYQLTHADLQTLGITKRGY